VHQAVKDSQAADKDYGSGQGQLIPFETLTDITEECHYEILGFYFRN
jgi:hypothetical protein